MLVSLFILRKVVPWIYQNLIGPKVFGCRINVKKLGEWACKYGAPVLCERARVDCFTMQSLISFTFTLPQCVVCLSLEAFRRFASI